MIPRVHTLSKFLYRTCVCCHSFQYIFTYNNLTSYVNTPWWVLPTTHISRSNCQGHRDLIYHKHTTGNKVKVYIEGWLQNCNILYGIKDFRTILRSTLDIHWDFILSIWMHIDIFYPQLTALRPIATFLWMEFLFVNSIIIQVVLRCGSCQFDI
jgi:hypothetical protein